MLLLCFSESAYAYAPMCDLSAATVIAELPAPPAQSGTIDRSPACPDEPENFAGFHEPSPPVHHDAVPLDLLKAAATDCVLRVGRVSKSTVLRSAEVGWFLPGFAMQVYRPPCV